MPIILEKFLPQHACSNLIRHITTARTHWLKNLLIKLFISFFKVDMKIAQKQSPNDYIHFNDFFTRHLHPTARPIKNNPSQMLCPVDGFVSALGNITHGTLLQAKGMTYHLNSLLAHDEISKYFYHWYFSTFYLSPKDYHRVHMPIAGTLRKTITVPGRLFSVKQSNVAQVPGLFARNERVICLFNTVIGPMAVIFVGAIFVGSVSTVWADQITPPYPKRIIHKAYQESLQFQQGEEIGHFNMGSTVIILLPSKQTYRLIKPFKPHNAVKMGENFLTFKEK